MMFKDLSIIAMERSIRGYAKAADSSRPAKGWIRAVREAFGMSRAQLASRIGLRASSVNTLERSEARGTITLESLEKLARGLGCRVVYAIVPPRGKSLEDLLRERAELVARERVSRVSHSMKLEDQALAARSEKRQLARVVESLLTGSRRKLWR